MANNQYCFRVSHSTYVALLNVVDEVTNELDTIFFSLGIFVDLSKAFDTLDHNILIIKLDYYGVRGTANKWFLSYLENRERLSQL